MQDRKARIEKGLIISRKTCGCGRNLGKEDKKPEADKTEEGLVARVVQEKIRDGMHWV